MTSSGSAPEYLVIVPGQARSKYAKSAPKYEQNVHDSALKLFVVPLRGRNLYVVVHHFYTSGHSVDLDNLLKSVLDGLKWAAYEDDSQIAKLTAQRYNISESYTVEDLTPEEIEALSAGGDFVSISVARL